MGYHYNWLERRWDPIHHDRTLTRAQKEQIARRQELLDAVIGEIEQSNDSAIKLFGGLFARTLAASDELLLRSHSKRLAEMGLEGTAK